MENESLFYKIRVLLRGPDKRDSEWDPDKFWTMFEAKKRRRHTAFRLLYPIAATLIFAVGYLILPGNLSDNQDKSFTRESVLLRIPNKDIQVRTPETAKNIETSYEPARRHTVFIRRRKSGSTSTNNSIARFDTGSAGKEDTGVKAAIENDVFSIKSVSNRDTKSEGMPSLLQMYEQAQRERALRILSVKLDDKDGYTTFWLTVNQHLLANKFSAEAELLHYTSY